MNRHWREAWKMEDTLQEGAHTTSDPVMLRMQFQMAACVPVCVWAHAHVCVPVYFDLTTTKIPETWHTSMWFTGNHRLDFCLGGTTGSFLIRTAPTMVPRKSLVLGDAGRKNTSGARQWASTDSHRVRLSLIGSVWQQSQVFLERGNLMPQCCMSHQAGQRSSDLWREVLWAAGSSRAGKSLHLKAVSGSHIWIHLCHLWDFSLRRYAEFRKNPIERRSFKRSL